MRSFYGSHSRSPKPEALKPEAKFDLLWYLQNGAHLLAGSPLPQKQKERREKETEKERKRERERDRGGSRKRSQLTPRRGARKEFQGPQEFEREAVHRMSAGVAEGFRG